MLRKFEGVRGVRRTRVVGCMVGFEGYVRWLEGLMMKPLGTSTDDDTDSQEEDEDMTSSDEHQKPRPPVKGKDKAIILGAYQCADELEKKRLTGWACEAFR